MASKDAARWTGDRTADGLDEDVRLAVYGAFAQDGRLPSYELIAEDVGCSTGELQASLERLADARHVVLRDGEIAMAHPFATVPLGFSVMGHRTLWWGGCAWDSFALPHLLDDDPMVLVATTCPGCGRALAWVVDRTAPPQGGEVAHFLVPVAHIWDDVLHSCAHQRLFCGEDCLDRWLRESGAERGYVMDLGTLWRLASRWYEGRLSRGYTRRDPATAAEYFRDVGLRGAFWGLDDPQRRSTSAWAAPPESRA